MFIVIELQKNAEGVVSNVVTSHATIGEAKSKYHAILSAAAISELPTHSAIIVYVDGSPVEHECFHH